MKKHTIQKKSKKSPSWLHMQNLWPSCDIEATPLKVILIKQWSLIIKQPDVKGWDNIFFKINEKSNGKQIKNNNRAQFLIK